MLLTIHTQLDSSKACAQCPAVATAQGRVSEQIISIRALVINGVTPTSQSITCSCMSHVTVISPLSNNTKYRGLRQRAHWLS